MSRNDLNEHREVERSVHPASSYAAPERVGSGGEHVHPESAPVSTERLAEEQAKISPEGRPADPRVGYRSTIAMVVGVVIVALGVIGVVGYYISPWLALAMLIVTGLCLTVFNPVVWASAFRAKDHEDGAKRATWKASRHP